MLFLKNIDFSNVNKITILFVDNLTERMKIAIHFRDELIGTGENHGDEVIWEGNVGWLQSIARYYQRQGYEGEALLKRLLERLQANTWAEEVES